MEMGSLQIMPKVVMLIGVPGSGKSTWVKQFLAGYGLADNSVGDWVILSSDAYIEEKGKEFGKTYDEAFKDHIDAAQENLIKNLREAIYARKNIIWDQTNLTVKSRKQKLSGMPVDYEKHAVFFKTPNDLDDRLASRPGKNIPKHIVDSMKNQLQEPSFDENFTSIAYVNNA